MKLKQISNRMKAVFRIFTLHNFILIEAKRKKGKLYSRIVCRTDFDKGDDIKILQHHIDKLKQQN